MSGSSSDYNQHWDEKFRSRPWGRYPPEDLVRFMGRHFANGDRSQISVLEVGCGPGANLWFLHREGYRVLGIDASPAAIEIAQKRLSEENRDLNPIAADLRVGNFVQLPWADSSCDAVVDIYAIYANTLPMIQASVNEVFRVLKPGGRLYSKVWGKACTGYGLGTRIEDGTYDAIPSGPFQGMGLTHFFDRDEIEKVYQPMKLQSVDRATRTDMERGDILIEEFHCVFVKSK